MPKRKHGNSACPRMVNGSIVAHAMDRPFSLFELQSAVRTEFPQEGKANIYKAALPVHFWLFAH